MSTYAIGDVQGCYEPLQRLIDEIKFDPSQDRLWFVGDLVNRGPDSLSVLRWVKSLGDRAITVLGNHELHLLAVALGLRPQKGSDTIISILAAPDGDELLDWVRHRPLLHRENPFVLVHAGLLPRWTITEAATYAAEAHRALQDDHRALLSELYNRRADHWDDSLTGLPRLAAVTAVLTRLRTCTPDGMPDYAYNGPLSSLPPDRIPWFRVPIRRNTGGTIIFGHWAALGLHIEDTVIGLDSGCVWGHALTAVRLEDRQVFQVPC